MTDQLPVVDAGEIPPTLALSDYFRNLDDWVDGKPAREPYVDELLGARGFDDVEKREFSQGREALWKLIPPITIEEIEEAELDPPALLAMGLALVLRARHALVLASDQSLTGVPPEPIPSTERLIRYVSDQLEAAGRKSKRGAIARLSALRADLQEFRVLLADRAREAEGTTADATADTTTGIATARLEQRESLGERILALLPKAMKIVTEPGAALRSLTSPGRLLAGSGDGYDVDPQVPEPLGLYPYLAELDHWIAEQPLDEPFLAGLLQILGYGADEKREYRSGRRGLRGLVPPIDATAVADANLDIKAAASLALGVVAWGYHGLARYRPTQEKGTPPLLQEAAEIVTALMLVLDSGAKGAGGIAAARLVQLGEQLESRGINALSALGDRKDAIVQAHRDEVIARRQAEAEQIEAAIAPSVTEAVQARGRVSLPKFAGASALLATAVAFMVLYDGGGPKIPPAKSYSEVPAVAIIRHQDVVIVRVADGWMALPEEERSGAAVQLWKRFEAELDGLAVDLELRSRINKTLGGVHVGEAWWEGTPEPEPEPGAPEEPAPDEASGHEAPD